jgi:inner membrane protein
VFSTPTPFNTLLWRVLVLDGEQYYETLVGWLDEQPPQLQPLPRGTAWRAQLADSPQHARLHWFTQGVLRYDRIGDQLVVTDLRLGMTGYHPFRFALAEWRDGAWRPIRWAERQSSLRADTERLAQLWTRIWQPHTPVPLGAWAAELER